MRLTYAVSVTIIVLAMVVAYRYLPARAQWVGEVASPDAQAHSASEARIEHAPIAVTDVVE
jgi:hypothetical protein